MIQVSRKFPLQDNRSSCTEIHMFEKLHVDRLSNKVGSTGWEHNSSAVVTLVKSVKDVLGIVRPHVVVAPDFASLPPGKRLWERSPWVIWLEMNGWPAVLSFTR